MALSIARTTRMSSFFKPLLFNPNLTLRTLSTRTTTRKLNNGTTIPALGFSTFQDPDSQEETVSLALQKSMRLIDTARIYDVEAQVGKGIKKSCIPREEIFLGTKLWCND
ncbi:hypothetical protein PENSUB_2676 [Penicillium subrubescens]|uniref:NADP-dependent oxidoreductase domain-containing protein n=2 Tax=Penicillium subrubescens TaxID=1316194 RepID=A0A1Q5UH53_9EURO|nr:hypothetical protein PENSUB_2676 [Penicillium subrubescens]